MKLTCIMCPVGCQLEVEKNNKKVTVTGNACPRGAIFGEKEVTHPERIVTTVKLTKYGVLSLKTDKSVPKKLIVRILQEIKQIEVKNKPKIGDAIINNIMLTGANVVVTSINE